MKSLVVHTNVSCFLDAISLNQDCIKLSISHDQCTVSFLAWGRIVSYKSLNFSAIYSTSICRSSLDSFQRSPFEPEDFVSLLSASSSFHEKLEFNLQIGWHLFRRIGLILAKGQCQCLIFAAPLHDASPCEKQLLQVCCLKMHIYIYIALYEKSPS